MKNQIIKRIYYWVGYGNALEYTFERQTGLYQWLAAGGRYQAGIINDFTRPRPMGGHIKKTVGKFNDSIREAGKMYQGSELVAQCKQLLEELACTLEV